jgi:hypothetical protein
MWVALFAAPIAWAGSHFFGWLISEANCEPVDRVWGIAFGTWEVILLVLPALVAIAGLAASLVTYRAIRGTDKDEPGPPGRIWILSIAGIVQSSLLLVIILLTHIGALALSHCNQG